MAPYSAYEVQAGTSVIKSVEAHCRHLTVGGTFSATGTPPLGRVEQWIDEAYYGLQMELTKEGYSVTVPASATAALSFLERLNVYGAVMQIEMAHPVTGRGEPNERYEAYRDLYDKGVTMLASDALSVLGVTRSVDLSEYVGVGGVSRARKLTVYDDSDAVQSRFKRGFGRDPRIGRIIDDSGTVLP